MEGINTVTPTSSLLLLVAALAFVGVVRLLFSRGKLAKQLLFVAEFRDRLHFMIEREDFNTYEWLTLHATRMQAQMGAEGVVTFRAPFATHTIQNYPVVLNVLPELRKYITDQILRRGTLVQQYHGLLDDALLRHQGTVTQRVSENTASLFNPIKWFSLGVNAVLSLPLWVLESLGLVTHERSLRVRGTRWFNALSKGAALLAFISAIVGLVTGWSSFLDIARRWLNAF